MGSEASADGLNHVRKKVGLRDLGQMTVQQFAQIQKMSAEGELALEHVKQLVEALPQFVELQKQTIEGLKQVVDGARESQREALRAMGQSLDAASQTLRVLAERAETDEARMQLAQQAVEVGRLGIETSRIIAQMNRDNNNLWRTVAGAAGIVAAALIMVFSDGRIRPHRM